MKTRKILFALLASASLLFIAASCKKYEDGPTFSLVSKKARVEGSWTVESAKASDGTAETDISEEVKEEIISFELTKDGDGKLYEGTDFEPFKWEFDDKKEHLILTWDGNYTETWEIRRLKQKELWIRETDADGSYAEIHFKQ